jgi:hypothetical protein
VDKLTKKAAVEYGSGVYDKIPTEVLITRVKKNALNLLKPAGYVIQQPV